MKKFIFGLFVIISLPAMAQNGKLKNLFGGGSDTTKNSSGNLIQKIGQKVNSGSTNLSSDEIIAGLKEALSKGAVNSTNILHQANGYFSNEAIKILMPPEAEKVTSTLRKMGMSSLVDKAVLSMNQAAEDAAGNVSGIFIDAIKKMTVRDGLQILRGGDFAATDYLKKSTVAELTVSMRPIIEESLKKVNATSYWENVFTNYNRFSSNKVNPDLTAYVIERALEGLFVTIGLEEKKIRDNPGARTSELLQKVFAK
ncbi:MAG: DUF4197 domain-containing protein [Ferruginibacter sp.]